jgi:hypothetical protein
LGVALGLYTWVEAGPLAVGFRSDDRRKRVTDPSDNRSPIAAAYQWVSRITIVAFEMVLPGLAGYWLDQKLGSVVLFMLVGFALGCTAATVHLTQMVRPERDSDAKK